jgi:hypothetical protein
MPKNTDSLTPDSDVRVLSAALLKLCLPKWLWRSGVIAATIFVWIWLAKQILTFGNLIRYDGLAPLGEQVVSFMTRFNPYLWIGIIVILSLILLSVLRTWLKASVMRGRASIVSILVVQNLAKNLSVDGVDVFKWVWSHEEGPVTVGDLRRTRDQIRSGRVRKLAMARAQNRALEEALAVKRDQPTELRPEPVLSSLELTLEPQLKPVPEPKPKPTDDSIPTLTTKQ